MSTIKSALEQLHCAKITFAEFYTRTLPEWQALAGSLVKRWNVPGTVLDVDDLVQEMLATVPQSLSGWEKDRSALHQYVVFHAMSSATYEVHRSRGACMHRPSKSESRAPVPVSMLAPRGEEEQSDLLDLVDPRPDHCQRVVESLMDAMRLARGKKEREIMQALISAGDYAHTGQPTFQHGTYDKAATTLIDKGWPTKSTRGSVARTALVFARRAEAV